MFVCPPPPPPPRPQDFCTYDDYNWDWSLNSLAKTCLNRILKVMVVKAPRILHIGSWFVYKHVCVVMQWEGYVYNYMIDHILRIYFGLHTLPTLTPSHPHTLTPSHPHSGTHHHKSCNEQAQADVARNQLDAQKDHLFPSALSLDGGMYPPVYRKPMKNYGGWGDIRDHRLCLSFVSS